MPPPEVSAASPTDAALLQLACAARQRAYAPYSKFYVGAALRLSNGQLLAACNVENASLGLSMCAERNLVATWLSAGWQQPKVTWVRLLVVAEAPQLTAPCGACRQVLYEFATPQLPIVLHNLRDQSQHSVLLGDLLPYAFALKR